MANSSTGRLPRHSDGGSTLPPVSTPRSGKKGSRKKKGLGTLSAPLTPQSSGGLSGSVDGPLHLASPIQQQQQQQKHSKPPASAAITPSRLGRRNAQSDAGQQHQHEQQQQVVLQHSLSSREHIGDHSSNGPEQQLGGSISSGSSINQAGQTPKVVKQFQWQQPQQLQQQHIQQQLPFQQQQQQQQFQLQQQHQQQQFLAGPPPPAAPPALPQGPFSTGAPTASSGAAAAAAAAAAAIAPRVSTLQHAGSLEGPWPDPPPTLWEFFYAEATPHEKYPTADVLWRQTERDRVYNFLLYVPYQLERIMIFGTLLCFYSFLGALTALPLRCLWAMWQMMTNLLLPGRRNRQPGNSSSSGRPSLLPGAQLYDLLCALLMLAAVVVLSQIKPGVLYYWMKDITSEFLKIQVLFTALEILDKILSNFGVDVLEALSSTCTLYTQSSIGLMQLLSDLLVAFLLITAHGSVLMCQAMVFAVTMNSKRNALLALMIATNFVELKGQVYKRTDTNKLWGLACQDIVERFQLLLVLCFVVVEDISNSGTWWPAPGTMLECGRIFLWEIVIDVSKHAVLGKFNDIRPGIYREYMRDLCSDSLDKHSHNTHKLVGFCPLGPAALSLRMVHTLFTLKCEGRPDWHLRCAVLLLSWMAACATQVVLGYSLKWLAYLYVRHHTLQAGGKVLPRAINVTPSGIKLFAPSGAPTAVSTAIKGSSAAAAVGSTTSSSTSLAVPPTPAVTAVSPLNPNFSPKGLQSRVAGAAGATQGGSPLSGASPSHSPRGSMHLQMLSAQLQMPVGLFSSSGGSSSRMDHLGGLLAASSGPQSFPGMGQGLASTLTDPVDVRSGPLHFVGGMSEGQQAAGLHLQNGSRESSSSSSGAAAGFGGMNGVMAHPALLAASLAANSAPSAAAMGMDPAGAAAGDTAAAAAANLPTLQTLSMPPRIGNSLSQQAGSNTDSPYSAGSQRQPFIERAVDARATFSDARPGWDPSAAGTAFDSAGAVVGAALADAMFASKEAPAAVLSMAEAAGPAGTSAPVAIAGSSGKVAHSSSYAELSAGGLVDRGLGRHNGVQQQQQAEQGWQQPKHRHRAKRE